MTNTALLFDLDGTLTDPGEGIINCAILALEHFGLPVPDRQTLGIFVGPPLRDTFMQFGVRSEDVEEAVRVFRSRYLTVGKFENTPYPGIHSLLDSLKKMGIRLFVATSKPEVTALEILKKFDLFDYFEDVCGALLDGTRDSKADVIAHLLSRLEGLDRVIMIGDTAYDVEGAAKHNIPTIGVAWGYGSVEEMRAAGAIAIAENTEDLQKLILA